MSDECNRRQFVCATFRGAAACALGSVAVAASGCSTLNHVQADVTSNRQLVVKPTAFGSNDELLVFHSSLKDPIYLRRHREDGPTTYSAVLTTCTHRGCRAEPTGSRIICPCHGSQFGNDGTLLKGPANRPLVKFPVERVDDAIFIELN